MQYPTKNRSEEEVYEMTAKIITLRDIHKLPWKVIGKRFSIHPSYAASLYKNAKEGR